MSQKTKNRRKIKRLADKRAKKAAMKTLYESYRDTGKNTLSRRNKKANMKAKSRVATVRHATSQCGNPGCRRCQGVNFGPFLNKEGKPEGMPQWMYQLWAAEEAQAA